MPRILLEKGLTVQTFTEPPKRFQPLTATDSQLDRYGYPRRPQESPLLQRWEETMAANPEVVTPAFRLLDEAVADPPTEIALPDEIFPETTNWMAGAKVSVDTGQQGAMRWVESTFTVPNLRAPLNGQKNFPYTDDAWLGLIDSTSSNSLICGYGCMVTRPNNGIQKPTYSLVWRWFPRGKVGIDNMPLNPGDILTIVLCMDFDSRTRARISIHNHSTKKAMSFIVTAPSGSELVPDEAMWWIRPNIINFKGPTSARFGSMYFDRCSAGTQNGVVVWPTIPVNLIDFDKGHAVANTYILDDKLFRIDYVGP